ncbi:MAG: hypothetical protein KAX49_13995 [Halanaerobiales bacterium]|nr:hypothetical protein [Halanaerobiales bacterium]
MAFITKKLKCALDLEGEFEENPKLKESWIGIIKKDNKLFVTVINREDVVQSQQQREINKIKEEFKKGIF